MVRPRGFRGGARLAAGSIIALAYMVMLQLSAQAAGPPITDPRDTRCQRVDPENVFFIKVPTPPDGQAVGPGSTIGSWFSDESGLHRSSLYPSRPFHMVFRLDGPSGLIALPPDISESFDQSNVFARGNANKECKVQVNIKSKIPATVNGHTLPAGDYTVTLQAWDNDQTRIPGPDMGTHIWHFSIAATTPSPGPLPIAVNPEAPSAIMLPVAGLVVIGVMLVYRRRRAILGERTPPAGRRR